VFAKQSAVKKYIVKLSDGEFERINTLILTGKYSAHQVLKARVLVKADASEAGEAWTDSQIAEAFDSSNRYGPVGPTASVVLLCIAPYECRHDKQRTTTRCRINTR
jgi:hypothetical protein